MSTSFKQFLEGDVIKGDFSGNKGKPQKVEPQDNFGSLGYQIVTELGHSWEEKPDYFSDMEKSVNDLELKKIEKEFAKKGLTLQELPVEKVFKDEKAKDEDRSSYSVNQSIPETFVIKYPSGNRYLVDRTGALTYIRFWLPIRG